MFIYRDSKKFAEVCQAFETQWKNEANVDESRGGHICRDREISKAPEMDQEDISYGKRGYVRRKCKVYAI